MPLSQCCQMVRRENTFVYVAYLDDSDTRAKIKKWQVLSAVMIEDSTFFAVELMSSVIIDDLFPPEKAEHFSEFHACELYGGYGPFEGIDQEKRFLAIHALLSSGCFA